VGVELEFVGVELEFVVLVMVVVLGSVAAAAVVVVVGLVVKVAVGESGGLRAVAVDMVERKAVGIASRDTEKGSASGKRAV